MDAQVWKEIWFYVFYLASGLFYLTVLITTLKGLGETMVNSITDETLTEGRIGLIVSKHPRSHL